jgi:ubiquinone/menaquinone biosynthesis C-methylase UbiE
MSLATGEKTNQAPRIFTSEYYSRIHALEEKHGWYRGMRDVTLRLVDRYRNCSGSMRILDAGCGTGGLLAALERFARPGGLLVGVDLAPEALQFSRERTGSGLVLSSVVPLPFAESSFDLITCSDVLQHVDEGQDREALEDFFRVLRPAGVLILRVAAGVGSPSLSHRYYRAESLARQLQDAGFIVEKASYLNQLSYWAQSLRRRANPDFRVEGLPEAPPGGPGRCLSVAWWKNKITLHCLRWEAQWLCQPGRRYRRGTSIICVARKPMGPPE